MVVPELVLEPTLGLSLPSPALLPMCCRNRGQRGLWLWSWSKRARAGPPGLSAAPSRSVAAAGVDRSPAPGQELVLTAALAGQVEGTLALLLVQASTLARRR